MKKFFQTLNFSAKYDESQEIFLVYQGNILIAKLYDDSGSYVFFKSDCSIDRAEMTELIKLSSEIQNQYIQLND